MTGAPAHPDAADARLLDALAETLSRQIDLAARGRIGEVAALNGEVAALLARVEAHTLAPSAAPSLRRIRQLRRRLALMLAQKRADAATEIDKVRRGRESLRAYGRTR